jgi:Holliday junction DNA helicase RuvA
MIASLRGTLISKSPTEVVLDVQGTGYAVSIPLSTFERLGDLRTEVTLLTHLHVREDAMQLFGFVTEEERLLFRLLISVNGIGPRMGQSILSGIPVNELRQHIIAGNLGALTAVPGIGRKLAERLVVELRDRLVKLQPEAAAVAGSSPEQARARSEALLALTSLGYQRSAAEKALRAALTEAQGTDPSLQTLIKLALRHTAGK